ncbi:MAG: YidC/Oxa1 family membrane protein insertase [Dehalococcoidia bacterium]|nr:YidC/Oxa1 family membrane protein insertase [Dehalococcoidia bacterium]
MPIGAIWQTFLETPLINIMVGLSAITFGSYGLAILVFTVITRALLFPLTLRMLHSMRALQDIQPQMQEIQKKYSDPKRRNQEIMKLYREAGVNPLGCLGPQLLQFPIFIALYQVIRITLGNTPEGVLDLSRRLYDVGFIQDAVPLSRTFLGMDLGQNGNFVLGGAVFAAMWLQQRISTSRSAATTSSANQAQMNQMMQWMLPLIFSWFVLFSPAGLGVYWFSSTAIGLILQWIFVGPGDFTWGSLVPAPFRDALGITLPEPGTGRGSRPRPKPAAVANSDTESRDTNASSGDERKDSRGGSQQGPRTTRPSSRASRRRRHHRR